MAETLTEELIDAIAGLVEEGSYPDTAAASRGVSRRQSEQWLELGQRVWEDESPDELTDHECLCGVLAQRIAQAEAECEYRWLGHWRRAALHERRSNAYMGWLMLLERRFPERWAKRTYTSSGTDAPTFEQELLRIEAEEAWRNRSPRAESDPLGP
jgi:hypothetical protein